MYFLYFTTLLLYYICTTVTTHYSYDKNLHFCIICTTSTFFPSIYYLLELVLPRLVELYEDITWYDEEDALKEELYLLEKMWEKYDYSVVAREC